MSLADNATPALSWPKEGPVTVTITCHCGEAFPLDQLDAAREHVAGHTEIPGGEPS